MIIYQSAKISCIKYTLTFNFLPFLLSQITVTTVTPKLLLYTYLHLLCKQLTNMTFSNVLFFWK